MFNELVQSISSLYKCECQDVFFDLLSPELNLDGVVYFYRNVFEPTVDAIRQHFAPAMQSLTQAACLARLPDGGPLASVLRKTFQSNWREILQSCLGKEFSRHVAQQIQDTL